MSPSPVHREMVSETASCLRKYCRGASETFEINRLVRFAAAIAQQKLWGRLSAAARAEESTVEQQALSSVGSLFRHEGVESLLKAALEDELDSDDVCLFLRFQAVVTRTAAQELFHRWGENDPLAAKLWRSLQRTLRHDLRFIVFPCDHPEWVALTSETDLGEESDPVGYPEMAGIVGRSYSPGTGIAEIVERVLSDVAQIPNRRKALQIEVLFSALREVVAEIAAEELETRTPGGSDDHNLSIAVAKAMRLANQDLDAKLDRYLAAGKLDSDSLESFRLALADLLTDCIDGGPAQSFYQYLNAHWHDLSNEKYRQGYRSRFEYLAEFAQDRFFDAMKGEFLI